MSWPSKKELADKVHDILTQLAHTPGNAWVSEAIVDKQQADWDDSTIFAGLAFGDLTLQGDAGNTLDLFAAAVVVRQLPGLAAEVSRIVSFPIAAPARYPEAAGNKDSQWTNPLPFPPWFGRRGAVRSDTVQQAPSFPWQVAALYSAFVAHTKLRRPLSHENARRKRRDHEAVTASLPLDIGRSALEATAQFFETERTDQYLPSWAQEKARADLGFKAAATRFIELESTRDRLQPLLDHLPAFAVRGIVFPTFAADDGLASCLSLVLAPPGPAVDHTRSAAALTAAGMRLRLALDNAIDGKLCSCILGFRPAPVERPDLGNMAAGRLPVLVDPCSWLGVAGILSFVLARGKRAGVLVVNPRSTSNNGLEVFTCDDIDADAPVIVLAAPFSDMSGYALVSLGGAQPGDNHHRFHVKWSEIEPFTRPKIRRDFASLRSEEPAPVTRHCLGINTDFIRDNSTDEALRYACATTGTINNVPRGLTDDDDWFLQAIPRIQAGLPPPRKAVDCDGPLRRPKPLEGWRMPGNSAWPTHVSRPRLPSGTWRLSRHTDVGAPPAFTPV